MNKVGIDPRSGFCGGVINAIGAAEKFFADHPGDHLYCLGDIVHNEYEVQRLANMGLVPLDVDDLEQLPKADGASILIRAHGQPPGVYAKLRELGFEIIDCTCPMVLSIQKSIREACATMDEGGQILLFGKHGHPEVLGLVGQVEAFDKVDVAVFESAAELKEAVEKGGICLDKRTEVFSQTTKSPVEYAEFVKLVKSLIPSANVHSTICRQVASRHEEYEKFAKTHDVVIFVSGKTSSNGKVLASLCKSVNIRTYHISGIQEIQPVWFRPEDTVGVCGATSTPLWLLEKVAAHIEKLQ